MKRLLVPAALAGWLILPFDAAQAAPFDLPDIPRCTELTPGAVSVDDTPVTLGLRVVLDGVSSGVAAAAVNAAQSSYAALNIGLATSFDTASFNSTDSLELLEEVKRFYGGTRPGGTHLVYVITSKNLTGGGFGDALAGQADCIGGVAYAANAFAVGEAGEFADKIMAHELGHLLGGHHHYANCGEAVIGGGDNLCTLMINDVGLASLPLSTLNGVVVRGHAQLESAATKAGLGESAAGALHGYGLLILLGGVLWRRRSGVRPSLNL